MILLVLLLLLLLLLLSFLFLLGLLIARSIDIYKSSLATQLSLGQGEKNNKYDIDSLGFAGCYWLLAAAVCIHHT